MTSVLDRSALEQSPLADLHLIANELGVDGFRRLRWAVCAHPCLGQGIAYRNIVVQVLLEEWLGEVRPNRDSQVGSVRNRV